MDKVNPGESITYVVGDGGTFVRCALYDTGTVGEAVKNMIVQMDDEQFFMYDLNEEEMIPLTTAGHWQALATNYHVEDDRDYRMFVRFFEQDTEDADLWHDIHIGGFEEYRKDFTIVSGEEACKLVEKYRVGEDEQ